jgi:hypothetical protein
MFRILETTRHHLCLVLSIYGGLRVGEIAALTIADAPRQPRKFFPRSCY